MAIETGAIAFVQAIMSVIGGHDFTTGDPVGFQVMEDFVQKHGAKFSFNQMYLTSYEDRVSLDELVMVLNHHSKVLGCKVAFIDNLNFLMEVKRAQDSIVEMDKVIHTLITLCKEIDMHIVMVHHPKKSESGRVENEFDIKGSSTAVQEAHNIFLFNRPKKEDVQANIKHSTDREIKIVKMRRRGKHVGKTITFSMYGGRYVEKGQDDDSAKARPNEKNYRRSPVTD